MSTTGGRFDFEDGGSYSGGWHDGKADGYGVCTGPDGQGEYAGSWERGFEKSGVYTWPSGNTYSGEWQDGKRQGFGVEIKGHWVYKGEWSGGYKGRYGVRHSTNSCAKYEGTWTTNFQDGYGVETYVDEGTYQGQWQRGMRHGFGVRISAPFGVAAQYRDKDHLHASLPTSFNGGVTEAQRGRSPNAAGQATTDRHRGGFVLTGRSGLVNNFIDAEQARSRSSSIGRSLADRFRLRRGQSTGDLPRAIGQQQPQQQRGHSPGSLRGQALGGSGDTGQDLLGANVDISDPNVRETYMGEWKADKRSGFGVSERSDGLKYTGEWYNDKKHGYGVTTLKDGSKEEGKYKDNMLITSGSKRKLFALSKTRVRDRVDASILSASRAAQVAQERAVIAINRKAAAKEKAENSNKAAIKALVDAELAKEEANKYGQHQVPEITRAPAPVIKDTRVRLLPDQDDDRFLSRQTSRTAESGTLARAAPAPHLLPPRQESSDSYTSNQSSSVGSSSVAMSPPPAKPPRSPTTPDAVNGPSVFSNRVGETAAGAYPDRQEPAIVARANPALYASDPGSAPRAAPRQRSVSRTEDDRRQGFGGGMTDSRAATPTVGRTDLDESTYPGGRSQTDARPNSFTHFRALSKTESSSLNSYRDTSDSAESGPQANRVYPTLPAGPSSPQIRLHPPTPVHRPGAEKTPRNSSSYRGYSNPEEEAPPGRFASGENRKTFSPVLSDRRYEHPVSHEPQANSSAPLTTREAALRQEEFDGGREDGPSQPRANLLSRQASGSDLAHRQQSNARIPTPHLSNPSPNQYQDYASHRYRSPSARRSEEQLHRGGGGGGGGGFYGTGPSVVFPPLKRRDTLPSIVHYPQPPSVGHPQTQSRAYQEEVARRPAQKETFLVENGIRRRLVTEPPETESFDRWETSVTEKQPPVVLQRFVLEPVPSSGGLTKHGIKSSLPDVHRARETTASIPREHVFALSQQRRDELRRQRDEMHRGTLVIRLADITAWCKENQLILVLVALNLSLAALFLNFVTHSNSKR